MVPDFSKLSRRHLLGTITHLAVPVVLANISQTLMGLVDTLMVGRLGHTPLAAVGVATLLFSAVAMTIKAVDTAAQTFTAQRVGAAREGEVGSVLATALTTVMVVGALFMVAGLAWPEVLMGLVSQDPEVRRLGAEYLFWRYLGILPFLVFFMFRAVFDGIGWTRIGMAVGIGMNLANVFLNWVLIFGKFGIAAMGVAGAALASSLSSVLAALVIVAIALRPSIRHRYRLLKRRNLDPHLLGPFLRIAWPPAVQSLAIIVAFLVFFAVLGLISTVAVAAGNVVMRIAALSFMPGFGVAVAVQTLVGQSLGKRDWKGAVRVGWGGVGLAMVFMGIFGLLFLIIPETLMRAFTNSEDLVAAGTPVLRLMGLIQLIDAVGITLAGALRGAGATRAVMLVDLFAGFFVLPICSYLFGVVLQGGLMGAFVAVLLWFSLYAAGMTFWFLRGDWRTIEI
jgi:putative MATE family efflux protein